MRSNVWGQGVGRVLCGVALPVVALAEGELLLPETRITAVTGYQQEAQLAPAALTVIEREQLQRQAAPDLAEALRDIPGVTLVDSGAPGMKRLALRGESARRVLIKVNGQPLADHSNYGTPLLIDSNMIERIEIVRGSASVVHGSNALGGVVNITTRKVQPGEQELQLNAGYYSATRGWRQGLDMLGAGEQLDWRLQLARVEHQDRRTADGRLADTDALQQSLSAELGYRLADAHRLSWQGDFFTQEAGAWAEPDSGVDSLRFPRRSSLRQALGYEYSVDQGRLRRAEVRLYQHRGKREMDNAVSSRVPAAGAVPGRQIRVNNHSSDQLRTEGLLANGEFRLFGENSTVLGLEYLRDALEADKLGVTRTQTLPLPGTLTTSISTSSQQAEQRQWSAFIQQQLIFNEQWQANLGARYYDQQSRLERSTERSPSHDDEGRLLGSASLVWQPQDGLTLRTGLAQGYSYPSLTQQYAVTTGGSQVHFGNPELKSEQSTTFELGARLDRGPWLADLTLYRSAARDLIDRRKLTQKPDGYSTPTTSRQTLWQWTNVSRAYSHGLEASLSYQAGVLQPYADLTLARRQLEFANGQRSWNSGLPRYQLRSGVLWDVREALSLDFYLRSYGRSRRDDELGQQTDRSSSYVEFNVGMEYQPLPALSLVATARNLTDRSYQNPDELPAAGRALDVELRWRF